MGKGKKQTTTQTYTPPKWVERASQQAIGLGQKIGSQEYQPYSGERVAALSDNESMGVDLARKRVGQFDPYAAEAKSLIERSTQSFTDADMSNYMNPYIKSALDPAAREVSEAGARRKQQLQSRMGAIDAWGGSRGALLESELDRTTDQTVGDIYKTGMSDAFDRATRLWGEDRAREMQGAGQLMDLGQAVQNASNSDITALMTTGATDRNIQQAMKDFDYQQFTEGRDWDLRNLGGLLASLQGTQGSYSTTQTTTQKQEGSALGQALGIATTLIGAFYNPVGTAAGMAGGALGGGDGGGFSSFESAGNWLEGGSLTAPAT